VQAADIQVRAGSKLTQAQRGGDVWLELVSAQVRLRLVKVRTDAPEHLGERRLVHAVAALELVVAVNAVRAAGLLRLGAPSVIA
jgi:hypothetical protein